MKAGVHVAGGSDAPVEAPTPLIGMADVTWAFFFTTKIIAADRRGGCFFFWMAGFFRVFGKTGYSNEQYVFHQNLRKRNPYGQKVQKSFVTISIVIDRPWSCVRPLGHGACSFFFGANDLGRSLVHVHHRGSLCSTG